MLHVETIHDLPGHVGSVLGTSDWVEVTQPMIDRFADLTNDRQWVHVDVERAAREAPEGKTIAHGYLTLSLLPAMIAHLLTIGQYSRMLNYGSNKIRFMAPVPSGSRLRATAALKGLEPIAGGVRIIFGVTMELAGSVKPAMVAETVRIVYE